MIARGLHDIPPGGLRTQAYGQHNRSQSSGSYFSPMALLSLESGIWGIFFAAEIFAGRMPFVSSNQKHQRIEATFMHCFCC